MKSIFSSKSAESRSVNFNWGGNKFTFSCELSADYLYLATNEYLFLNNELLLEAGGFKNCDHVKGVFTDEQGTQHEISFSTRSSLDTWQRVSVTIDKIEVFNGGCPIRGLVKAILIYLPLGFMLGISVAKLLGFINIYLRL